MNDRFGAQIIDHLVQQGVRKIFFSPGSRSSLLALAATGQPRLEKSIHFDERGMAFQAYGYAKATQSPVAVLTTSGSAVGNIFPAVMEASHDHVPLILLTADRPAELQNSMANQTCDQVKIFGNYVRWYAEIPAAEAQLSDDYLGSTIAHAVYRSTVPPPGPVHLNCQFREPFFSGEIFSAPLSTHYESSQAMISKETLQKWADKLSTLKRGVVVAGSMPSSKRSSAICRLAEKLDWPILPDLMAGLRSETSHPTQIAYYVDLLKSITDFEPDCILHLGDRLISKPLLTWLSNAKPSVYLNVAGHPYRCDPFQKVTHRLMADPALFCEELLPLLHPQTSWFSEWKSLSHLVEGHLDEAVATYSEPGLIRYLHHHLPPHFAIYFSNSMPIRDADRLFFPRHHRGPIFGQRGLSGIDGNISTIIGLAEGSGRPLVAVVGDLAALHDLNSLAQLSRCKTPVILIIVNNGGGGIFSFLPFKEQKEVFEESIATSHEWNFAKAAEMFHIPYVKLTNFEDLHRALKQEKTTLLEFPSNRERNVHDHEAIDKKSHELIEHFGAALR